MYFSVHQIKLKTTDFCLYLFEFEFLKQPIWVIEAGYFRICFLLVLKYFFSLKIIFSPHKTTTTGWGKLQRSHITRLSISQ